MFFCDKSGARIVAPGISKSAGGDVPDFDGSEAHLNAEAVARRALSENRKSPTEQTPSVDALVKAKQAAIAALEGKSDPKGTRKPQ